MQLKVLDHIIIGNNCYFSFADEGLIEDYDIMLGGKRQKGLKIPGWVTNVLNGYTDLNWLNNVC